MQGTPTRTHASADAYDPFEDTQGPVGHALHFEVERLLGPPGEPARFRKTIKPGVGADLLPMIHRENMLLMDMASRGLRHVAQSLAFTRDSSDTPFVVTTLDAGPSLNLWRRYDFAPAADPRTPARSFLTPAVFLRLLRHVLIALREFHDAGFIHCDIHAGNICLPFERPAQATRAVRPLFERLRLIDFGHTLSQRVRFDEPLRLDPDAPESLRRVSPAFRAALRRDAARQKAQEVLRLDARIDLYALGAWAAQFLGMVDWSGDARAVALHPRMSACVDALLALDSDGPAPPPGLHAALLRPVDELLADLAPAPEDWLVPRLRGGASRDDTPRETPLVAALPTGRSATAAAAAASPGAAYRPAESAPVGVASAPLHHEATAARHDPTVHRAAPAPGPRSGGRRAALGVLALGTAGAAGWAWYAGLVPGLPRPSVRASGAPAPKPSTASAPAAPPVAAAPPPPPPPDPVPEPVETLERSTLHRAVDDDLNRMIGSASNGGWREVESLARGITSRMRVAPPGTASAQLVAGERAIERGDYSQAAAALRRAAQRSADDWAVWSAYGYSLVRLNELSGARLALGRALRLRPHDASAWAHLAEVLALQDREEAAAAALKLSVYFSSQRPRTLAHLRTTGSATRIAPELQAVVADLGNQLDRIPERTP